LKLKTNGEEEIESLNCDLVSIGEPTFSSLSSSLAEIRKLKGVIGYILRNDTSALIDLASPEKLTDYALFSYEISETCQEMAKNFSLGETESMLVEGDTVKILCVNIGENKVSVFMEKSATHAGIIKRILL
jgi:predicted regulator of Ras-like GTPase activity (Roadblock/LC7/MglB family)